MNYLLVLCGRHLEWINTYTGGGTNEKGLSISYRTVRRIYCSEFRLAASMTAAYVLWLDLMWMIISMALGMIVQRIVRLLLTKRCPFEAVWSVVVYSVLEIIQIAPKKLERCWFYSSGTYISVSGWDTALFKPKSYSYCAALSDDETFLSWWEGSLQDDNVLIYSTRGLSEWFSEDKNSHDMVFTVTGSHPNSLPWSSWLR